MGTRRTDRLWLLGGIFAMVVVVAAACLLVIKPVYTRKREHQDAAGDSQVALIALKHKLADLENDYRNRAAKDADKKAMQAHLPDNYDMPNFIRSLHVSDPATGTVVSAISVGAPAKVAALTTVVSVPITLTVSGTPANISRFLNRLQTVQTRAVLISSVSLGQGDTAGQETATVVLDAFCTKGTACTTEQS